MLTFFLTNILESRERIYQAEPGVYYIYILPTNGLSLQTGNVPKVYYSLQVQFFVKSPEFITIPARAMRNLDTLQIEGNPDNLEQLKATFYPLSAGLINDLDLNITYNMIIASDAIISNYYSKCGVNAPKLDDLDNPGNQGQSFQLRVIQTSSKGNQQLSYMINEINLKNSDLSIALEANILQQSYQGELTTKVFYTSVSMKKRSGTQINSDIILIISKIS